MVTLFNFSHSNRHVVAFHCEFNCISLITGDVEHLLMCSFVTHISSLGMGLFKLFKLYLFISFFIFAFFNYLIFLIGVNVSCSVIQLLTGISSSITGLFIIALL